MKIGVNTFLFTSRFTGEDVRHFKTIKDLGFDGVEITLQEPGDFTPVVVRKALDESSLSCLSFCGLMTPGRDLRGSTEEQESADGFIRYCIDTAVTLGSPLVSGPLYSSVGRTDAVPAAEKEKQFAAAAGSLRELAAYAAEKGISLAIEPLIRFETDMINSCNEALALIDAAGAENLGVHLDTFHMNVEESSPVTAVIEAGEKLFNLHVSDNTRGAPGTGSFNWKGFADALRYIGYSGPVLLESFHPDVPEISFAAAVRKSASGSNMKLAEQSLRFLRALFS